MGQTNLMRRRAMSELMTDTRHVGFRIKELREKLNLTQDEVAIGMGVGRSTLAGIEAGLQRCGARFLLRASDYFKVPVDWLLLPPGSEHAEKHIQDREELALVRIWRLLEREEKLIILRMLHGLVSSGGNDRRSA